MVLADLLRRASDGTSARESRLLLFGEAGQQLLYLRDGAARVKALGTGFSAVHDGVAAEHGEGVPQPVQSLLVLTVPAVYDPPVGLHQHSRAQVPVIREKSSNRISKRQPIKKNYEIYNNLYGIV